MKCELCGKPGLGCACTPAMHREAVRKLRAEKVGRLQAEADRMRPVVDAAIAWYGNACRMWVDIAKHKEEQERVVGKGPVETEIEERHMRVARELREAVERYAAE